MDPVVIGKNVEFGIPDWINNLVLPKIEKAIAGKQELINIDRVELLFTDKENNPRIIITFNSMDIEPTEDEYCDGHGDVICVIKSNPVETNSLAFRLSAGFKRIPVKLLRTIRLDSAFTNQVSVRYTSNNFTRIELKIIPHDRIDSIFNVSKWKLIDE